MRATILHTAFVMALVGCAPSLESLVADRHLGQAVCSASWREDSSDEHRERVAEALRDVLEPRAHVQALDEDQLVALLGEAGHAVHDEAIILRLVFDLHDSDLDQVTPTLAMSQRGAYLERIADTRQGWATLTGETVPQKETLAPSELAKKLHDLKSGAHTAAKLTGELSRVITLGILPVDEWVGDRPRAPQPRTIYPTLREYACAAPVAESLYQALVTDDACQEGRCVVWRAFRRPDESTDLHLEVTVDYSATAGSNTCDRVWDTVDIALEPAPVDEAIAAVFGDRLRTFRELEAP